MNMYFPCSENKFPSSGPSEHLLLGVQELGGKLSQVLLTLRLVRKATNPVRPPQAAL